jgi:hypothetical protein
MNARAVDDAVVELRHLRQAEWEDLGLALLTLGLAVGATQVLPPLALPLFLGGLLIGARGIRALWLRWDLVERLAEDRDAYVVSEVRDRGLRETTMERRRTFAAVIRASLHEPVDLGIALVRAELEALVIDLEDPELTLHPSAGVACFHLVTDFLGSPLLNLAIPPEELRSRIAPVRSGFTRGSDAA